MPRSIPVPIGPLPIHGERGALARVEDEGHEERDLGRTQST
jgi:hypothetical protein